MAITSDHKTMFEVMIFKSFNVTTQVDLDEHDGELDRK